MNEDAIQIRSIQHYLYCPRRFALLEIDRDWQENAFVAKADLLHEHVHDGSHSVFRPSKDRVQCNVRLSGGYALWDLRKDRLR